MKLYNQTLNVIKTCKMKYVMEKEVNYMQPINCTGDSRHKTNTKHFKLISV